MPDERSRGAARAARRRRRSSKMNTEQWLRWGLGSTWLTIAILSGVRAARGGGRGGFLCAALGLAFATAVTLRWHVELLFAARDLLRRLDLYADRVAVKIGIATLLSGAVLVGVRTGGDCLRRQPRGLRLALGSMLAFGVFLVALTAFLDDLLPGVVLRSPGRYLLEFGFAAAAALGIGTWRGHARAR